MYDLKGSKKLLSSTEDRPIFKDQVGSRPRTWLSKPRPRTSKTVLEADTSVNDAAERVMKFHADYAAILTDNEKQRQNPLQIVEKHRQDIPNIRKSTLVLQRPH